MNELTSEPLVHFFGYPVEFYVQVGNEQVDLRPTLVLKRGYGHELVIDLSDLLAKISAAKDRQLDAGE